MNKVVFQFEGGGDVTIFAAAGENLLDLARKANVVIDAPCSGNGSCGKCKVQLLSGDLKSKKSLHLSDSEFNEGWRLACWASVIGDVKVLVPDIASAYRSRMKTADLSSPEEAAIFYELQKDLREAGLKQESAVRSVSFKMDVPTLADTMPDNERFIRGVCSAVGVKNVSLPYFALKKLPDILRDYHFELRCVIEKKGDTAKIVDITPDIGVTPVCGLAIDIGTTTVSGLLVDIENGTILAKASAGNGQIRYGADVINRIVEQQKPGGVERLQKAIIGETLLPLIDLMCRDAGIERDRIFRMTIASNTTMNHLLLGINANYLRMEPYIPAFFEIQPVLTRTLGIDLAPTARLILAPNIGSYVGGDITAGTLAGMIWNKPNLSMLIDLGTNGEIVVGNNEFLMACACSAGPAFEGGDISCGMRATNGAVEACTIDEKTLNPNLSVIGGIRPVGLCGSGIIDVIAGLYKAGAINGKGRFNRESSRIKHDEFGIGSYILAFPNETASGRQVSITEVDIDNFIRAKGAIFSAVITLLASLGYAPDDIHEVFVAGGIGSGINIKNAIAIGMFPDLPVDKYSYIGNSSLTGAYAMLVSEAAADRLHAISKSMTYLELSTEPGYMDAFIAACFLPHTDLSLFPSAEVQI